MTILTNADEEFRFNKLDKNHPNSFATILYDYGAVKTSDDIWEHFDSCILALDNYVTLEIANTKEETGEGLNLKAKSQQKKQEIKRHQETVQGIFYPSKDQSKSTSSGSTDQATVGTHENRYSSEHARILADSKIAKYTRKQEDTPDWISNFEMIVVDEGSDDDDEPIRRQFASIILVRLLEYFYFSNPFPPAQAKVAQIA